MTQQPKNAGDQIPASRSSPTHKSFADLKASLSPAETNRPSSSPPVVRAESKSVSAEKKHAERIIVRRERKGHGGKAITLAEGIELSAPRLGELARDAAKALGTGARVEEGALVVQGDQAERLIAWLTSRGFTSVARGN